MSKAQTPQEELVASFARHSVGASGVFHPDHWEGNYEPADLIFAAERSVLLCNMYAGNKRFETATSHNVEQARKRIRDWKQGKRIKGTNKFRSFDIGWEDVDKIAVLSVADCRDPLCDVRLEHWAGNPESKVAAIGTLTTQVLGEVARLGGGGREILHILKTIAQLGRPIAPEAAVSLIQMRFTTTGMADTEAFRLDPSAVKFVGRPNEELTAFDVVTRTILGSRQQVELLGPFADLSWSETAALASAAARFVNRISAVPVGGHGPQLISATFRDFRVQFGLTVARHTGLLNDFTAEMARLMTEQNLYFWMSVYLDIGFGCMFAVSPEAPPSAITSDLSEISSLLRRPKAALP